MTRKKTMDAKRFSYLRDWLSRHADDREPPMAWAWYMDELLKFAAAQLHIDETKEPTIRDGDAS